MAGKTVSTTLPDNVLFFASRVLGVPGISVNRLIESAFRVYNGESPDEIRYSLSDGAKAMKSGGRRGAIVDESLIENISNKSRAARVGLAMIAWGFDRQEAEDWADSHVKWGRQSKDAQNA
jgi:hypothetical protein